MSSTDQKNNDSPANGSAKHDDKSDKKEEEPAGGYDATPIPHAEPGYTVKITIHRAQNLPMADINSLSSDPYVITQMYTSVPTRHKEDPALKHRTFTIRRDTDPEWNDEWVVANVPRSGFKLKCRLYDEDPGDHDDRLGNAHIEVPSVSEKWEGFEERGFKLKKRMGSKRAYLTQAIATGLTIRHAMAGYLVVSIKVLGRTESEHGGRLYTVGPIWYTKHYSPLIGRMLGKKTPGKNEEGKDEDGKSKPEAYNFQANQFQLHGPVPAELYHRYVEFRPFVKKMFTAGGVRGFFLHKALSHQHAQIYHYDRKTEYGVLGMDPNNEVSLKFLELVDYDRGGRIFTYVLTLDSLFRFTETGKEFGVDMLSKHTMHSDVSTYVAFSGEFFVRRLEHPDRAPPEEGGANKSHPADDFDGGPPDNDPPKDPAYYELVIDNDSGTYRPNAKLLPKLKEFLSFNFPGIHVVTLDCQADAEVQQKMKKEQRDKKKEEGNLFIYRQQSDSSISSSDISDLDNLEGQQNTSSGGIISTVKNDIVKTTGLRKEHWKKIAKGRKDGEEDSPKKSGPSAVEKPRDTSERHDSGNQKEEELEAKSQANGGVHPQTSQPIAT